MTYAIHHLVQEGFQLLVLLTTFQLLESRTSLCAIHRRDLFPKDGTKKIAPDLNDIPYFERNQIEN